MKPTERAARLAANDARRSHRSELRRAKRARQEMLARTDLTAEQKAEFDRIAIATVELVARRARDAGVNIDDLVGPQVGRQPWSEGVPAAPVEP